MTWFDDWFDWDERDWDEPPLEPWEQEELDDWEWRIEMVESGAWS